MVVTFDTNVLLSATLWDGSVAQKLLFELIRQNIKIYSSKDILLEYEKILKRDFEFSDEEISKALENIFKFITLINPSIKINLIKDDPTDNMIIECAIESHSKYIITYDKHLLNLKEYQNMRIIKPEEARAIF